jgi:hypothetical protein
MGCTCVVECKCPVYPGCYEGDGPDDDDDNSHAHGFGSRQSLVIIMGGHQSSVIPETDTVDNGGEKQCMCDEQRLALNK